MTVIGMHGCKQAPGVTTLALALACALDTDGGAVVIEADSHGGDLSALLGRPPTPGWISLAAAGRHGGPVDLDAHLQPLPGGGSALLAPSEPAQADVAFRAMGDRIVDVAARSARHVIFDMGRGTEPVGGAEVSVLVCHPTVAGVEQARVRADHLDGLTSSIAIAVSASGPYRPDEVSQALGRPVVGPIPRDARGVAGLSSGRRGVHRSPLVRFAASLTEELRTRFGSRELTW